MDSSNHNHQQQHQQQVQQHMNSGLTRYRSAPSSYFSSLINNGMYVDEDFDPFFNPRVPSPESERINMSRFMSGRGDNLNSHQNLDQNREEQPLHHMMYQNHVHNNNSSVVSSSSSSAAMVRQSSSPAGSMEHINMDNGYAMMRSMDRFQTANGSVPDSSFSSANRLKSPMVYSSASRVSSGMLTRIPEGKTMIHNNGGYAASFDVGSWDGSLTDGFMNEYVESDRLGSYQNQEKRNGEGRIRSVHAPTGLTHQLSLPTSSTELSVKEQGLQFQDNVPLRSRAKRGCATHPRSIAERVRRTRISERMRKLQDLVPNMDKQTSTADMLDLAVDYIKELQNQVETLSDRQAKCTCQNKLKR